MSQGTNQLLPFKMFEYFYTIERFNLISILSTNKIGVETDSISRLKEFLNPYSLSHYQNRIPSVHPKRFGFLYLILLNLVHIKMSNLKMGESRGVIRVIFRCHPVGS